MSILEKILTQKRKEVARQKALLPENELKLKVENSKRPVRSFSNALRLAPYPAIIAEVKLASPSRGVIRNDLKPLEIANSYAPHATCLSVLTDEEFFGGSLSNLRNIRLALNSIPLLRKDFIIDSYQVWEAREAGADAILLIAAALSDSELEHLAAEAAVTGLEILLEVHTADEMFRAISLLGKLSASSKALPPLIGVNNRDLNTFQIDLETTVHLGRQLSTELTAETSAVKRDEVLLVAESGLYNGTDLLRLKNVGANAFLIGESLLKSGDPGANLAALIADSRSLS